jgi:hypothetical protein
VADAGRTLEGWGTQADQWVQARLSEGEALAGKHDVARFTSGAVHAVSTIVTGTMQLAGSTMQLAEESTREAAGQTLEAIAQDPAAVGKQLWDQLEQAFKDDPAKMLGEVAGNFIPVGAALQAAGKASKLGQVGGVLRATQAVTKLDDAARAAQGVAAAADVARTTQGVAGAADDVARATQGVAAAADDVARATRGVVGAAGDAAVAAAAPGKAAKGASNLADEAARLAGRPRILGQEAIDRLNKGVEPLADLMAGAARDKAFVALYRDPELQKLASEAVTQWVMGGKDQVPLREAFAAATKGGDHPLRETVEQLLETREARWDRLAARHGIERPTHFRLFRGVSSEHAMEELVQAWETPGRKGLQLQHHSVNSWSTNPSVANDLFAKGGEVGVVYEADVPFRRTLADKWADGAGFLQWTPDQDEVIVATEGLTVPATRVRATFQGKTYGFEDREALIAAWRATHPKPQ